MAEFFLISVFGADNLLEFLCSVGNYVEIHRVWHWSSSNFRPNFLNFRQFRLKLWDA